MNEGRPTVLVTGANGFVGSRLCRFLALNGYHVAAGVRRTADLGLLKGVDVEYRYGDLSSVESLGAMVAGADYVVHNAGVVKARRAETYFEVNEIGARRVCEALAAENRTLRKLIYISSLAAAGPVGEGRARTETDPPNPITTYGKSKLAGERAVFAFADRLHVVALRAAGVYGPGDREILTVFKAVNMGLRPIFGDPARRIQLVHVDDLCRAVGMALTGATESGAAYFIAEDRAYTMADLVAMVGEASGKSGFRLRLPAWLFKTAAAVSGLASRLAGRTPMLTLEKSHELLASWEVSTEMARRAFGFRSTIAFADGARETFAWYRREGWLK